jgi:hypothetical protein
MKLKATSIFLGLCLAVIVSAASLAHAQNGFAPYSSFHVERLNPNQYAGAENCLTEQWGAIDNQCSYSVDLVFSLPADVGNGHSVTVEAATASNTPSFTCTLYAITGDGNSGSALGSATFGAAEPSVPAVPAVPAAPAAPPSAPAAPPAAPAAPPAAPALSLTVLSIDANSGNGRNIQLICWGVPAGAEITNLTWN